VEDIQAGYGFVNRVAIFIPEMGAILTVNWKFSTQKNNNHGGLPNGAEWPT
jgi:hypothetical protein